MLLRKKRYILFSVGKLKNHLWQKATPSRKVLVQLDVCSDARRRAGAVFFLILFLLKTFLTVDLHIFKKHSHKKRKGSLGVSLDRVLFEAQIEFLKILVPRLPQNSFECKHSMCRKIKATVFFMWQASWSTDISSFYYSDINLFLIDYACFKLSNIWLLIFENNSRAYHYSLYRSFRLEEKHCYCYYSR